MHRTPSLARVILGRWGLEGGFHSCPPTRIRVLKVRGVCYRDADGSAWLKEGE